MDDKRKIHAFSPDPSEQQLHAVSDADVSKTTKSEPLKVEIGVCLVVGMI